MAQVSGTTDSYDLVGIAEDIEDVIRDISPTETPFLTMCERQKASNTLHQWQTDALAAAAANRQVEGDDATYTTASPTVMLGNYTQISRKTLIVSRTADSVRKYGRAREMARLTTKYGKELKRDIDYALVRNQASSAGGTATARSSAGIESMIVNYAKAVSANTGTTTPGYAAGAWSAPTDGTATATLTKAMLDEAIAAAWTDGGDPSVLMVNNIQKADISALGGATTFAGNYNVLKGKEQGMIVGAADIYISDFGNHRVVLNRQMRQTTVLGLDPEHLGIAYVDGIKMEALAKTGDADKMMLITEYCLTSTPDAHCKVVDLPST